LFNLKHSVGVGDESIIAAAVTQSKSSLARIRAQGGSNVKATT